MSISEGKQINLGDWLPRDSIFRKDGISTNSNVSPSATLEDLDREHIMGVLELTGWRVNGEKGAARILGMKPTTLEARMKKWESDAINEIVVTKIINCESIFLIK